MNSLNSYTLTKEFLVCIDSDGCAMDTMNIKHKTCFGPKFVDIYGLADYRDAVQSLWENVNLYTKTRGINRFQSLALVLRTIHEKKICPLSYSFEALEKWTRETSALSNDELLSAYQKTGNEELSRALDWSYAVNEAISHLPDGEYAYAGVKEALLAMSDLADIVVVSSANSEALKREWTTCGLTDNLSLLAGQELGTKAYLISELTKMGSYNKDRVLMIGDAMGDLRATEKCGVLFYPILAGHEEESWKMLCDEAFGKFVSGSYIGEYQTSRIDDFQKNLS